MRTRITLILSFALMVMVPWSVFWYVGENERDNPDFYAETKDLFAAVAVPNGAFPSGISGEALEIIQSNTIDSPERMYAISPEGVTLSAPATVSVVSPIEDLFVSIPLILLRTASSTRPLNSTHVDIDYKTNTIRVTGEISTLGTLIVIEDGFLGFEVDEYFSVYELDTPFSFAWRIRKVSDSYLSDNSVIEAITESGYEVGATSTDFSVGYSKEIVPKKVPLDDATLLWDEVYEVGDEYTCEKKGEFDWMFDRSVDLRYKLRFPEEVGAEYQDIVHTITLRVTSKCINGDEGSGETPI